MSKIDFIEYMMLFIWLHIIIVLENIFIPQLFVFLFFTKWVVNIKIYHKTYSH